MCLQVQGCGWRQVDPWCFWTAQPSLFSKLQASERACHKDQGSFSLTSTCLSAHMYPHMLKNEASRASVLIDR